jgi:type IV secretory pathway VirB3-like protein
MPIVNSSAAQPINSGFSTTDTELPTFQFIASWLFFIIIMVLISKSRLGYVIIYYSLLLMILLILLTEYQQFSTLLNGLQTVGQFDASQSSTG